VPLFRPGKGGINKGFTQIDLPTSQQVFTECPQKAFQNSCPLPLEGLWCKWRVLHSDTVLFLGSLVVG
jgi:hypothetical protein